ncbi:MAG: hypothetical protein Q9181_002432 [Wetmoreana brouardii]
MYLNECPPQILVKLNIEWIGAKLPTDARFPLVATVSRLVEVLFIRSPFGKANSQYAMENVPSALLLPP